MNVGLWELARSVFSSVLSGLQNFPTRRTVGTGSKRETPWRFRALGSLSTYVCIRVCVCAGTRTCTYTSCGERGPYTRIRGAAAHLFTSLPFHGDFYDRRRCPAHWTESITPAPSSLPVPYSPAAAPLRAQRAIARGGLRERARSD